MALAAGIKILVVEDDASLALALVDALGREGFEVHQARNGRLGLSRALEIKPDLILLDLLMPEIDGITMLKTLRADDWGKKVPVIILTNVSEMSTIAEAIKLAPDYIVKANWRIDQVVERVKLRLRS